MIKAFVRLSVAFLVMSVDSSDNKIMLGDMSVESLFESHLEFQYNFDDYEVNTSFKLATLAEIDVHILFGSWCHDSKREVPRMLRILDAFDVRDEQIHLIGLDFKKNEPENRGEDFNISKTPTFIFSKDGVEIGRIEESPDISLESHLSRILEVEFN